MLIVKSRCLGFDNAFREASQKSSQKEVDIGEQCYYFKWYYPPLCWTLSIEISRTKFL